MISDLALVAVRSGIVVQCVATNRVGDGELRTARSAEVELTVART